jgi:anti-anti-sigma regulatory factor
VPKVERLANGTVLFRLSGRIEKTDVEDLRCLLSLENLDRLLALDLSDVTYLDPTAIAFLAECEANGIDLRNCPVYLREWIDKEKEKNPKRKQ